MNSIQPQLVRLPRASRLYRFGCFEFETRTEELTREGLRIRLQDQPTQVLAMLLEQAGDLVLREDLQRRLWPADTFVDFDIGLNTAVRKLRQALRDSVKDPVYIETVPRRGYRFLVPVAVFEVDPARRPPQLFPAGDWLAALAGTP